MSTKIHTTCDALGHPTEFHLTPGQACDWDGADVLLADIPTDTVLPRKARRNGFLKTPPRLA